MKPEKPANPSYKFLPFLRVETDIPIPPVISSPKRRRIAHARWGLERLKVGESVYMAGAKMHPKKLFYKMKMKNGILFTARVCYKSDGSVKGIRVWRVI
jgi:hypothetical protein